MSPSKWPLVGEGWSDPSQHDCEKPVNGVLCMETAAGAIYSGWADYVWLCAEHLAAEVALGWEEVDFSDDERLSPPAGSGSEKGAGDA